MLLAAFCVAALARGEVAHMQVLHDDAQFKAALNCNDGKLLAIDFTASWCGPCKMIGPRFGAFAESGNFPFVRFAKVDVDENSDAAAACGVRAMPTFQFYRHGTKVDEFTGAGMLQHRMSWHKG
uniref:Thioredoxin domain-containing protein n=1 Tax=Chrysotila carterae TaxID=13221 RepID=A0A7S4B6K4_CHRCT